MSHRTRSRAIRLLALAPVAALALAACGGGSSGGGGTSGAESGTPVDGGALTAGIVGGSAKDSLDAHSPVTHPDEARVIALYATLATYDTNHKREMMLAESIEPNEDGTAWTVKLKPDLKFSDGKPLTSEDVAATFKRITDPANPKSAATALSTMDRDNIETPDATTAIFHFKSPFAIFPDSVAQYATGIVPKDYDPAKPVGAGAFMLESFTPGQQSVMVKNPNFFEKGQPHLAKLTLIDFPDDTARVNALLGGQVDAIDQLPLGQIKVVEANPALKVLESETGSWIPFTMRVDQAPFDNVKVRQAMRLIVNRKQMIEQVLGGHGQVGNDLYAPFDPCFNKSLPQREQDIAQAKKLLAEAGQPNLSVELVTSPAAAGLVEAATVLEQQAKQAGVTIKLNKVDPGVFYGDDYLKWTFSQDFWFTRDFLPQAANSGFTTSPYNETHWNDPEWTKLVNEATATIDETKRCDLIQQAQKIEYDSGGYIIWGFPNNIDAYSTKVHGLVPDKSGIPLTSYNFAQVWVTK